MATAVNGEAGPPQSEDLQEMMGQKAHELFAICDLEQKGFICKRDMQRLKTELPLTPEQLEDVFDSLDLDKNGYLTLEEFTSGFETFLGLTEGTQEENAKSGEGSVQLSGRTSPIEEAEFQALLQNTGLDECLDEVDTVRALWRKLRDDQPQMVNNFEEFLARVAGEMKKSSDDFQTLENALKTKTMAHDEEVRRLYDEMEQQIKSERERTLMEEKARERQAREQVEKELQQKDRQLQDLLLKHQEMEQQLHELNLKETETKQENQKLQKEKHMLENRLDTSQRFLDESKGHITELRQRQRSEKRDRAMTALQISEGMALERESLVKQLNILRDMNRRLRDEKDEAELRRTNSKKLHQMNRCSTCDDDDIDIDEVPIDAIECTQVATTSHSPSIRRRTSHKRNVPKQGSVMSKYFESDLRNSSSDEMEFSTSARRKEPVGTESQSGRSRELIPERVFKVVLVGDSGVGKSSFIHRFCSNTFRATFSATIGVDFQVKNVEVDGHMVTLQLWDTAGQERFRSITKQYFRKADGVIIMYDVTSETSFKSVRNWMISVKEGTEENTVIMMLGNKMDLIEDEEGRVVTTKDGCMLSDEYGTLFFETSAKAGLSVKESVEAMARLLREKEDKALENSLQVTADNTQKKKGCCD